MKSRRSAGGRRPGVVLALLMAGLWNACGGGGGGGGGPTEPTPKLVFTPSALAGANSLAFSSAAQSTLRTLVLELRASNVQDLYAVSFDLTYPTAQLSFVSASEGDFLSAGGTATTFQIAEQPNGRLVVGLSRLGAVPGNSGNGLLLTLEFSAVGNGIGALGFDAETGYDSALGVIDAIRWIGGSVEVVL